MDLNKEQIAAKRSYLLNLSHFRKASDNTRKLTENLRSAQLRSLSDDVANIELAIKQEENNIEDLCVKSRTLYEIYNAMTS